jgi:hypothetical protein
MVLGLIFAFENIATNARVLFLFKVATQSLFFTIMFSTFIGIVAGFFLGLTVSSKGSNTSSIGSSDIDL